MLIITNGNQTEAVLESNYEKHEEQNGAALQISFSSFSFPQNIGHALLDYEVLVEDEDGHEYKVKQYQQNGPEKRITATHIFYELGGQWKYDIYGGTRTFNDFASWLFSGAGWTFQNVDVTGSQIIANYGENNVLQLLKILCATFKCEYEILAGKVIRFAKILGEDNDLQYRYRHNINDLTQSIDTTSLKTEIRGYGANGLVITYTSPLASHPRIGVRVAEPFYDDSITTQSDMVEALKTRLPDVPETVAEVSVTEVDGNVGDYVWIIHEELDLLYQTRILAKKTKRNYADSMVTVGNTIRKDLTDILVSQKASIEENKKITRSKFEQTNDRITMEVETLGESIAAVEIRVDAIDLSVNNRITQEVAAINVRADNISLSVNNRITQEVATLNLRADGIAASVRDANNNIAQVDIKANQISSTVNSQQTQINSLDNRVGNAESSITQTASQITSKVSYSDYTGSTITSLINQDPYAVKISAQRLEFTGAAIFNGSISGATDIDINRNINIGNAIYFNNQNFIDNLLGGMDIHSWNELTVQATQASFNCNIYSFGNQVTTSRTAGLGFGYSAASKTLYVSINGSDVGSIKLT